MWDVGCIGASISFFFVAIAYTWGCQWLNKTGRSK
jgi:hypothetical protein